MKAFVDILRPFTLAPPFLGIVSGSFAAAGSTARAAGRAPLEVVLEHAPAIALGGLMAATLNGASNVLNQVTELELDRLNKPERVLPSGRMGAGVATAYAVALYALALAIAWAIEPAPGVHDTFWCALAAAVATVAYSSPPLYLKARGGWANLTIALPRGALLKVAGWGVVASALDEPEAWAIGAVFFAFLLGATSTKDFADEEGDRAAGVETLVVRHGAERVARWIAPAFVLPWMALALGLVLPDPAGDGPLISAAVGPTLALCAVLVGYGIFTIRALRRDLAAAARDANHPSWAHMYGMMMVAQVGLAVLYLL